MTAAALLEIFAEQLWRASMNGTPSARARFEFMSAEPQPNELVLVWLTHPKQPPEDLVGYLVKVVDLPVRDREEGEEQAPTRRYWTIRRLDGSLMEWHNVQIIRLYRDGWSAVNDELKPILWPGEKP